MSEGKLKAVSLKYPKNAACPFVTAKGKGELAQKILDVAKQNNIPIQSDENLVNVLSSQDIGDSIPEDTWEVLAIIFSSILQRK